MALLLSREPVGLESDVALGLSQGTADVALCLSREPVGPEADVAVGLSRGMLGVENQITFRFLLVLLCRNKTSQLNLKRRHTPTTSTTTHKSQSMRRLAMTTAIKKAKRHIPCNPPLRHRLQQWLQQAARLGHNLNHLPGTGDNTIS
eukprot:51580-Rhodomonas_salina.1